MRPIRNGVYWIISATAARMSSYKASAIKLHYIIISIDERDAASRPGFEIFPVVQLMLFRPIIFSEKRYV